jgi:hypothetical protein
MLVEPRQYRWRATDWRTMLGSRKATNFPSIVEEYPMHMVIRTYSGQAGRQLVELIAANREEVEQLLRGVNGLVSYTAALTPDGGVSVTVCNDKAGTDESVRIAREWVAKRATDFNIALPTLVEGEAVIQLK